MAIVVVEDLLSGSSATFTTTEFVYERAFHVSGLEGGTKSKMLAEAASADGVPGLNQIHPSLNILYVRELRVDLDSDRSAVVIAVYRTLVGGEKSLEPTPASEARFVDTIEVGGALQQVSTTEDYANNRLAVGFIRHKGGVGGTEKTESSQIGVLSVMRPRLIKSWTRTFGFDPSGLAKEYLGKVNAVAWSADPGSKSREWLCVDFAGRSNDNGRTWPTTMSFEKSIEPPTYNWDEGVSWIEPSTGRPPNDITFGLGNGIEVYRIYPSADFNKLGLGT